MSQPATYPTGRTIAGIAEEHPESLCGREKHNQHGELVDFCNLPADHPGPCPFDVCGCTGRHHTERCRDPKLRRRWRLVVGGEDRRPLIDVDVDSLPRAYALRVLYLRAHPWGQITRIGGDPR